MTPYLKLAVEAARAVIEQQSVQAAGGDDANDKTVFVTATPHYAPAWTSVGKQPDGSYAIYPVPEVKLDPKPTMIDMAAWDWLDSLSAATGDDSYRRLVDGMAKAFAARGFDERSGLPYVGQAAQFDASQLKPAPVRGYDAPMFKPMTLPLERMWAASPAKMSRMLKAVYYGLITRPETMSYNRFCSYDFDDGARKPSLKFYCDHVAFASTGAWLIEYWSFHFAKTGDRESLAWAKAMTDKWEAVQDGRTGLLPHWFGNIAGGDVQPPRPFCHVADSQTALIFLRAADILRKASGADAQDAKALGDRVYRIGLRLSVGIARFGYDEQRRIFPPWHRLSDGREDTSVICYAFPTQADKDEAMLKGPSVAPVAVFAGTGLYGGEPWTHVCHSVVPEAAAQAARITGDKTLIERSEFFAKCIAAEANQLTGPFNKEDKWTFPASAGYISQAVALHQATGRKEYLDQARRLADMEIEFLSRPLPAGKPPWWQLPQRGGMIKAMIELHQALAAGELRP